MTSGLVYYRNIKYLLINIMYHQKHTRVHEFTCSLVYFPAMLISG